MKKPSYEAKLVSRASMVKAKAYAPYSGFSVGAALLSDKGRIFTGTNVENASYGGTICAERSAVSAAISAGHRRFKALAVIADSPYPVRLCGLCLQVLSEFCSDNFLIICATSQNPDQIIRYRLKELLPNRFRLTK